MHVGEQFDVTPQVPKAQGGEDSSTSKGTMAGRIGSQA